jgi:hypothetical protein
VLTADSDPIALEGGSKYMMMNRHAPAKLEGEEIITNAEKPVSSRSGSNLEIWFAKKR